MTQDRGSLDGNALAGRFVEIFGIGPDRGRGHVRCAAASQHPWPSSRCSSRVRVVGRCRSCRSVLIVLIGRDGINCVDLNGIAALRARRALSLRSLSLHWRGHDASATRAAPLLESHRAAIKSSGAGTSSTIQQHHRPGRRTDRMMVASIRSAMAIPQAHLLDMSRSRSRTTEDSDDSCGACDQPGGGDVVGHGVSRRAGRVVDAPRSAQEPGRPSRSRRRPQQKESTMPRSSPLRWNRAGRCRSHRRTRSRDRQRLQPTTVQPDQDRRDNNRRRRRSTTKLRPNETNTISSHEFIASMKSTFSAMSPPTRTRTSVSGTLGSRPSADDEQRRAPPRRSCLLRSTPIATRSPLEAKRRSLRPKARSRATSSQLGDSALGSPASTFPATTISVGLELAYGNTRSSASSPASTRAGQSMLTPLTPRLSPKHTLAITALQGDGEDRRPITAPTMPPSPLPGPRPGRCPSEPGTRSLSTPSPNFRSAARSRSAARTERSRRRSRRRPDSSSRSRHSSRSSRDHEGRAARPALRGSRSRPRRQSRPARGGRCRALRGSARRRTANSRCPAPGPCRSTCYDEDRERECLRHQRAQTECDHDRHDRHHERTRPATTAPKTRIRITSAAGSPTLELARLEIVLRELVEVVVDRPLARHHHGEAVPAVLVLDQGKEPVDVLLALHADQRGVPSREISLGSPAS